MKVGIYLETPFLIKNDRVFCSDVYTLLLNSIAKEYELSYLIRSSYDEGNTHQMYKIDEGASYWPIDNYNNLVYLFSKYPLYRRKNLNTMKAFIQNLDELLVMVPSPISLDLINLAITYNKRVIVLIRQDTIKMIGFRFHGLKGIIARCAANYLELKLRRLLNTYQLSALTLGEELYNKYRIYSSNVISFASSRFRDKDIIDESSIQPLDFKQKLHILYVGRVEINKGLNEILQVFSNFTLFDFHLTIVGDGTFMNVLKQQVIEYNLTDKVTYLGYIPFGEKLLGIYRENDLFILPSYSEGLPQVILEAMASGCLVLSTDVGSIPYVIKDNINGFLFKPQNPDSLKNILLRISHMDSSFLTLVRQNGLKTAKRYSYEKQIKTLKHLLYKC